MNSKPANRFFLLCTVVITGSATIGNAVVTANTTKALYPKYAKPLTNALNSLR